MNKVRRALTNSRIDNMYYIYKAIKEEFDEKERDEIDKDELFKAVMKKIKGRINPALVQEEINSI